MKYKDLDIHGRCCSFFLSKYVESLVLLDRSSGATIDSSDSEEATELQSQCSTVTILQDCDTLGINR